MDCTMLELDLKKTGFFSELVLDYVNGKDSLRPFFSHEPNRDGLLHSIKSRQNFNTNRNLLVETLIKQYSHVPYSDIIRKQLDLLKESTTFTITTAHQPNIFTGYLYFVYKILHAVKLCRQAKEWYPQFNFVPVYYMGSEDADLDELGTIFIDGEPLKWNTDQTGAVGRMDPGSLDTVIERLNGQFSVLPYGKELISIFKSCYLESDSIQLATFRLVHQLFEKFGLLVLIPDNAVLKSTMIPVFTDELLHQRSSGLVNKTLADLTSAGYKAQASPREINLFYLDGNKRERIIKEGEEWQVLNSNIKWKEEEILTELNTHPEKFSPNVILRGIFQETILPDIAFIGGGGELAYWLELKGLFNTYQVPFPVLILRNSFLFVSREMKNKIEKSGLTTEELFLTENEILSRRALQSAKEQLNIEPEFSKINGLYEQIRNKAMEVDATLDAHVGAIKADALKKIHGLQKKMMRAEKRK
ncbi:MAG TPA: bacillithiol biosynthesis cysteine-adding enzyme BshC, partial [Parasegetibacter sp.]